MTYFSFCYFWLYVHYWITDHKMTKSSYLSQMLSDPKNKDTLFSSSFKVEETKVYLILWSEVNLVSYDYFVVSWRYWTTTHKQNYKILISHLNDFWSKKIKALYFLQLWKLKKLKCTYFHNQRSTWWVMTIFILHEDTKQPLTSNKMTKSS